MDTSDLEFYSGFNKKFRKSKGRYANKQVHGAKSDDYWGVVLLMKVKLGEILAASDEEVSNMLQKMNKKAEVFYARQKRQINKQKLEKRLLTA